MIQSQKYLRILNEQVRFDKVHLKNQKFETEIFWYYHNLLPGYDTWAMFWL